MNETKTVKYKAKERYSIGWTDPAGVFTAGRAYTKPPPEFFAIPEETLMTLWLAKFGERYVTFEELENCEEPFYHWARKRLMESKRMSCEQVPGHFKFGYTLCK